MNDAVPAPPVLECRALRKVYREGPRELVVLDGVELSVASGERLAIVGQSGSGKSTLLNMLGGLDLPTSGEVRVEGRVISGLSERERGWLRNRALGFVYQFHHLLGEFDALENVAMPLLIRGDAPATAAARARELLTRVGLGERLGHKPGDNHDISLTCDYRLTDRMNLVASYSGRRFPGMSFEHFARVQFRALF